MLRLRLDLHIHTSFSHDAVIKIEELAPYAKLSGLDGFAVTDHDTLEGALRAQKDCPDFIVVPGMEIETRNGHLLAMDPQRTVQRGLSFHDTVRDIHKAKGFAILAHPYSLVKSGHDFGILSGGGLDAVEAANASSFPYGWCQARSRSLALRLGLPVTGGSDAHVPQVIGRAYTVVESETRDLEGVLDAIRSGRTGAEGRGVAFREWGLKLVKQLFSGSKPKQE